MPGSGQSKPRRVTCRGFFIPPLRITVRQSDTLMLIPWISNGVDYLEIHSALLTRIEVERIMEITLKKPTPNLEQLIDKSICQFLIYKKTIQVLITVFLLFCFCYFESSYLFW